MQPRPGTVKSPGHKRCPYATSTPRYGLAHKVLHPYPVTVICEPPMAQRCHKSVQQKLQRTDPNVLILEYVNVLIQRCCKN